MATLADLLRTGYKPPTESPLADPIKEHFASLPQKFNENQANQMDLLARAFPGNTYESMMTQGDPKAMSELAMQAPIVGMTKALLPRKELIGKKIEELSWEIPKKPKNSVLVDIPLEKIEHGESAMPGGKLTWPTAKQTIKEYAEKKTDFPPIEVMGNDPSYQFYDKPFMIYDGSHRFEAAKLRGDKTIKAYVGKNDADALEALKSLK
jgi:uncharacterized ParB-like nuclease family protein